MSRTATVTSGSRPGDAVPAAPKLAPPVLVIPGRVAGVGEGTGGAHSEHRMRALRASGGGALVAVLLAASAAPALAQGAEPKGMPQFDFSNPLLISQIVWGAVIFLVFYVLAARWALPQVTAVLERRQELIAADLETARRAKGEADAAVRELTEARRASHAEAQRALDAATAEAKATAARATAEMNERLDAQLVEAEGRIGAARTAAMGALREVATGTAQLVVDRLTGRSTEPGRVSSAVDAVLAERAAA